MAKASGGAADQLRNADPVQGVRTLIASGKVTVAYSDYGTAVTTTAPNPSDTVEPSELAKMDKGAPPVDPGPGGMVAGTPRPPRRRPGERGRRWRDGGG
ncbi:hypothetical protein ACWCXH_17165 [Kitasatospora sp. NPDC001660]